MATRSRDESGATAVIVAICLLLLFGAGAVAVDLGSAWETKRDLVVDTDAAALAAAKTLIETDDCGAARATAEAFLEVNGGLAPGSVTLVPGTSFFCPGDGTVRVDATQLSDITLAGAIGTDEIDVFASTTAKIIDGDGGGGLRPFSVCMLDPEVAAWIAAGAGTQFFLPHGRTWNGPGATVCGGASGNWGYTCYEKSYGDENWCNAANVRQMILTGFPGVVDLGTPAPDDGDCRPDTPALDDCDGQTGAIASVESALSVIRCPAATAAEDCEYQFAILGIDSWTGGSGTNATLNPTHFVGVVLRDYQFTGKPEERGLTLELVNLFDEGTSFLKDEGTLARPIAVVCAHDGGGNCS